MLGLKEALPSLVGRKFSAAKAGKHLIFSETEIAVIRTTSGIPFQLRFCPSLAKKPTSSGDAPKPVKKFDPFENPSQELFIAEIPASAPSHILVLNKFPVIENHFIIATKSHKEQSHLLEQDDIALTYECVKAWEAANDEEHNARLFAFFNSGPHSGASQPHRHIQFLPIESMKSKDDNDDSNSRWELLMDLVTAPCSQEGPRGFFMHPSVPFVHFAKKVSAQPSPEELYQTYRALYELAHGAVLRYIKYNTEGFKLHPTNAGDVPISYNLAMTSEAMIVCPRRSEGTKLHGAGGVEMGLVALNGTVLSGSLMVKGKDEWDLLRDSPKSLDQLLEQIGLPLQYSDEGVDDTTRL